ncbi:MAG: hypothetical protein V4558_14495 [Gemmatimonadota bacterium]
MLPSSKLPWRALGILLLLSYTIPTTVLSQDISASDQVTITRLGYRATKAVTAFGAYAVARELGMGRPGASVVAATAPVVASKLLYALRGQPGGKWPNAGFVLRDAGSEIVEGSGPMLMVWAKQGGRKQWYRWPIAVMSYGAMVGATWKWGAP